MLETECEQELRESAVQEGLFLYERGLDPYDGGIFHQVSP